MGTEKERDFKINYTIIIKEKFYHNLEQIIDYIKIEKQQPINAVKVGEGIIKTMNKILALYKTEWVAQNLLIKVKSNLPVKRYIIALIVSNFLYPLALFFAA